jgi:hypothetical protein
VHLIDGGYDVSHAQTHLRECKVRGSAGDLAIEERKRPKCFAHHAAIALRTVRGRPVQAQTLKAAAATGTNQIALGPAMPINANTAESIQRVADGR